MGGDFGWSARAWEAILTGVSPQIAPNRLFSRLRRSVGRDSGWSRAPWDGKFLPKVVVFGVRRGTISLSTCIIRLYMRIYMHFCTTKAAVGALSNESTRALRSRSVGVGSTTMQNQYKCFSKSAKSPSAQEDTSYPGLREARAVPCTGAAIRPHEGAFAVPRAPPPPMTQRDTGR